jgi:hypothetical protein
MSLPVASCFQKCNKHSGHRSIVWLVALCFEQTVLLLNLHPLLGAHEVSWDKWQQVTAVHHEGDGDNTHTVVMVQQHMGSSDVMLIFCNWIWSKLHPCCVYFSVPLNILPLASLKDFAAIMGFPTASDTRFYWMFFWRQWVFDLHLLLNFHCLQVFGGFQAN